MTRPWVLIAVLFIIAAVLGWLASAEPPGAVRQIILAVVGFAAAAWGGHLAYHGWRR